MQLQKGGLEETAAQAEIYIIAGCVVLMAELNS